MTWQTLPNCQTQPEVSPAQRVWPQAHLVGPLTARKMATMRVPMMSEPVLSAREGASA